MEEMMIDECPYKGECQYCMNCVDDCYIKELLDDFYNLEKRYFEKEKECEELKKQILKQANAKIQLDKLNEKFGKDYCNIKQALQNIKTLINEDMSTLSCECCTKNNDECSRCFKNVVKKVNNILSEVENEIYCS